MNNLLQEISQKIKILGIIQAGANIGQECKNFEKYTKNIICFEPVTKAFQVLKKNNPEKWFIKNYNEDLLVGQPDEEKIIKNLKQFKNENKKYKKNRL